MSSSVSLNSFSNAWSIISAKVFSFRNDVSLEAVPLTTTFSGIESPAMRGDKINKKRLTRAKNVRIFSICSSSNCFGEDRRNTAAGECPPRKVNRDGGGGDGGDGGGGVNHRKRVSQLYFSQILGAWDLRESLWSRSGPRGARRVWETRRLVRWLAAS